MRDGLNTLNWVSVKQLAYHLSKVSVLQFVGSCPANLMSAAKLYFEESMTDFVRNAIHWVRRDYQR